MGHVHDARHARPLSRRSLAVALAAAGGLVAGPAAPGAADAAPDWVTPIVDAYAGGAVAAADAVGVGVVVVVGEGAPGHFAYGDAVAGRRPMTTDALLELGSVTKVFTTNLFGQELDAGRRRLDERLGEHRAILGDLPALKQRITLKELADFTSGLLDVPPHCRDGGTPATTGCQPAAFVYPPPERYSAQDFLTLVRTTTLRDWQAEGQPPVDDLPAPYHYSNTGNALLGLILAAEPGRPLDNASLDRWHDLVAQRILDPLGMRSTFLDIPERAKPRAAAGYALAHAVPVVEGGAIASILLTDGGKGFARPPRVTIAGGGGTGAAATAEIDDARRIADRRVTAITVAAKGRDYIAPAEAFASGLRDGKPARQRLKARVVVSGGRVAAVLLMDFDALFDAPPAIEIAGGRTADGRTATAEAGLFDGRVMHVGVVDGGSGYVEPLTIRIEPGKGFRNAVSMLGPAGFLRSDLADMARFARAALGARRIDGRRVPTRLTRGFEIAERAYACQSGPPRLRDGCGPDPRLSGLAWEIAPLDRATGTPRIVLKDGAIRGFSSMLMLAPAEKMAVVVLANSDKSIADTVARNVLFAVLHTCRTTPKACR